MILLLAALLLLVALVFALRSAPTSGERGPITR